MIRPILGSAVLAAAACAAHHDFMVDDAGMDASEIDASDASVTIDASVHFSDAGSDVAVWEASTASFEAGAAYIFAHTPSELYQIDPTTNTMTDVGPFTGCGPSPLAKSPGAIDLAIDGNMNAYITTPFGIARVDLSNAHCMTITAGSGYPNSLSFVPAGTLDPKEEALVGYHSGTYVRIDTTYGTITTVGSLPSGYASAGDLVSVKDGGTFLSVGGNGCGDCLIEVDPTTGDMIKNYGALRHNDVWGLAFWAGTVYGFDMFGHVFTVTWDGTKIVTADLPVTPSTLSFYGAGSTTFAPVFASDGGGIPIN